MREWRPCKTQQECDEGDDGGSFPHLAERSREGAKRQGAVILRNPLPFRAQASNAENPAILAEKR